jgi:chemotaxis response regulator CheB
MMRYCQKTWSQTEVKIVERKGTVGIDLQGSWGITMPRRDIVVIGGSAGSITPLIEIVKALPQDFAACILVVVHLSSQSTSKLPSILQRAGVLEAKFPSDGEIPQPGHIYVAPPDKHLLLENGLIRLSIDAQENGFRPAIDPLFRAAAHVYETLVIGVLLSGRIMARLVWRPWNGTGELLLRKTPTTLNFRQCHKVSLIM